MCWFKPTCEGVPMFPGGMCAECDARMERRVVTIPYRVRCILDESMRRYAKQKKAFNAVVRGLEAKERASMARAAKQELARGGA